MCETPDSSLKVKVFKFFDGLATEITKTETLEYQEMMFDMTAIRIFSIIFATALKNEKEGEQLEARISRTELLRKTSNASSIFPVYRRLRLFAHYSLITVDSEAWRDTKEGKRVRETQLIRVNDRLKFILDTGHTHSIKAFVKSCLSVAARRNEYSEFPNKTYQGFDMTVEYGRRENDSNKFEDLANGDLFLNDKVDRNKDAKEEKRRENERWRKMGDEFIRVCADIWTEQQGQKGFGYARPAWEAPTRDAAPAVRSERANLLKIFERYGGAAAGLGWFVYTGAVIETDPNTGKVIYDPMRPHQQSKFADDPPRVFAKNFQTLINDPSFKSCAGLKWPDVELRLKHWFGGLVDVGPRDGVHYSDRLGYAFGDVLQPPK